MSGRVPAAPRVLSIAGTDPTGGAGVQADLKSIAANGGYGMSVVTALVAQNTQGVRSVHRPPESFLREQLDAVGDDVEVDAVKVGMLADAGLVRTVHRWLLEHRPPVVVVDPVMVATSGDRLLDADAVAALVDLVRDVADLVTPNVPELAVLAGSDDATDWDGVLTQARAVAADLGVRVLAKGGHLDDGPDGRTVRNALVGPGGEVEEVVSPRVDTPHTHGTGCSLSSAVATLRASSGDWPTAAREATRWLHESVAAGATLRVGRGRGPVSHFAGLWARGGVVTAQSPTEVTDGWWAATADVRAAIDELDLVVALGDGTLDRARFDAYVGQDALYLLDFARALAAASHLAPSPAEQAFWAGAAQDAVATELALHGGFLPPADLFAATPGAALTAYTDHLLAAVGRGSYPVLVAALLPCFWVYTDVGRRLAPRASDDHPYAAWLRTYGDEGFAEVTAEAIRIVGETAAAATAPERERMWQAFAASTRHEHDFFARAGCDAGDSSVRPGPVA
ncbi:bifunctional hydroxymethylpyrimidine kinase/phosphomethylpyrimidine kinase [Nocardioides sp. CFH 31398]|uniref:bifunctional hydroxymethylpyrimidine kinase/phosphomethylpyrimidine kinase n=1 Tax=Nocardioides sp. CFH 31398 TaxID=2919579 RepID=UPI001F057D33|nr:bifunctional hydroxymethylpyrimidine kinase/phosphomethylpyrimidine kinase [Nocardioides sp. CFH 31398]MCH1868861.1 bifunctional hydroxymethylpyrimidine kinase/phosphomethylpyrimidine kinase [Nocardioides sp. CFH 31398]